MVVLSTLYIHHVDLISLNLVHNIISRFLVFNLTIQYASTNPLLTLDTPDSNLTTPANDAIFTDSQLNTLLPLDMHPLLPKPSTPLILRFAFAVYDDGFNHGAFDNTPYIHPKVPALFTAMTLDEDLIENKEAYGPNTNSHVLKHMEVTELVVINDDGKMHPS